jgi:cellulose biosynthesis protein BcsQ
MTKKTVTEAHRRSSKHHHPNDAAASSVGMFSAATFGAVLEAQSSHAVAHERVPISSCPVVAFYGFRGGSGRTTALTHIAAELAKRGSTIVAMDLDLEAPGLSTVLRCEEPDEGTGALALLRIAEQVEGSDDERLRIAPHLVSSGPDLPKVRVIPAGKLGARYYADLDLLNPSLWHVMDGPNPLRIVLDRIQTELTPDIILVDCRTGLAPLSAAAIFHESDVVIVGLSTSRQSHAGARAVVEMLRAAQSRRNGVPASLLVPTMFSESAEGLQRREELLDVLDDSIRTSGHLGDIEDNDLFDDPIAVVRDGIPFRTSLSVSDVLSSNYHHVAGGAYEPLLAKLDGLLGIRHPGSAQPTDFNPSKVLEQLESSIAPLAFAEDVEPADVEKWFLQPTALRSILASSTFYIVGAKGSGKSWLYTRMVSGKHPLDVEQTFLRGHGPSSHEQQDADFGSEELKELDREFKKSKTGFEPSFWRLRAVATLARSMTTSALALFKSDLRAPERKGFTQLVDDKALFNGIVAVLRNDGAERLSRQLLRHMDEVLVTQRGSRRVLVYDGLDTGFGSTDADLDRRKRFVSGLVDALEGFRGSLRTVGFKVLL